MTAPQREAYDVKAAAQMYSVSPDTILRAIKAGELEARQPGRKYVIGRAELADWFKRLPVA